MTPDDLPPVTLDQYTATSIIAALDRLTDWLTNAPPKHTRSCAKTLSLGETKDPDTMAAWTDALAVHLLDLVQETNYQHQLAQQESKIDN